MDLDTLANLAEIIGVLIVVGGFVFALMQILHFRRQRRDMAAIELVRSFNNPEFARAIRLVMLLPSGISAAELRQREGRYEDAALFVSVTLESVGVMVDRRVVARDVAWELMGGIVLTTWDRLNVWVRDVRREEGQEKFNEWLEWLADEMRLISQRASAPAYLRRKA